MSFFSSLNINYDSLPIFKIKDDKKTSYIDYIDINDIKFPVMKGTDYFNRPFLIVKFYIDGKILCQVFFKRYSDINCKLYMGGGFDKQKLINTLGGIEKIQFELLENIINNKIIKIEEKHRPYNTQLENKYVYLYDEKRFTAIKTIQKAWRKYRYNPKYKFCKIVQYNNYLEILNS